MSSKQLYIKRGSPNLFLKSFFFLHFDVYFLWKIRKLPLRCSNSALKLLVRHNKLVLSICWHNVQKLNYHLPITTVHFFIARSFAIKNLCDPFVRVMLCNAFSTHVTAFLDAHRVPRRAHGRVAAVCLSFAVIKTSKDIRYKQKYCRPDYLLDRIDSLNTAESW